MREIVTLSLILGFVCLIAAFSLSFVYRHTKPIIDQNRREELRRSLSEVLPGAKIDYNPVTEGEIYDAVKSNATLLEFYKGMKDGEAVYAALVSIGGYQGAIKLLIGFDTKGPNVLGVKVLEHAETPGLGSRIEEESFLSQFKGKLRARNEYDTITGATISSSAVINGLVNALTPLLKARGGR